MTDVVISELAKEVARHNGYDVVETLFPPRFFWLSKYFLTFLIVWRSLFAKASGSGLVIGSFSNISLLSCVLSALILREKMIIFLNHNHTTGGFLFWLLLDIYKRQNSYTVVFDLPKGVCAKLDNIFGDSTQLIRVLHPSASNVIKTEPFKKSREGSEVRIGYVGRIRPEKNIDITLDAIRKISDYFIMRRHNVVRVVGVPNSDIGEVGSVLNDFIHTPTDSYYDYINVMNNLDIIILFYDSNSYAYRPSGVLSEAISSGVFSVVFGGGSLKSQVESPTSVGFYCKNVIIDDEILVDIYRKYMNIPKENFDVYLGRRSVLGVADEIVKRVRLCN